MEAASVCRHADCRGSRAAPPCLHRLAVQRLSLVVLAPGLQLQSGFHLTPLVKKLRVSTLYIPYSQNASPRARPQITSRPSPAPPPAAPSSPLLSANIVYTKEYCSRGGRHGTLPLCHLAGLQTTHYTLRQQRPQASVPRLRRPVASMSATVARNLASTCRRGQSGREASWPRGLAPTPQARPRQMSSGLDLVRDALQEELAQLALRVLYVGRRILELLM